MSELVFVYVPCPSKKVALSISKALVKEKLVACANIHESFSVYEWKGSLVSEKEFVIVAKTLGEKFLSVESLVKKLHPYSVPCICCFSVKANKEYYDWVFEQLT